MDSFRLCALSPTSYGSRGLNGLNPTLTRLGMGSHNLTSENPSPNLKPGVPIQTLNPKSQRTYCCRPCQACPSVSVKKSQNPNRMSKSSSHDCQASQAALADQARQLEVVPHPGFLGRSGL